MTPEIELAKILGELPSKDKLASALEKLPVEQLEEILRNEGFVREPDVLVTREQKTKSADSWGRELAKEAAVALAEVTKEAFVDQAVGGAIGYSSGKAQKARGEKHTFGGKQLASLLLPGGIGYQVGRKIGHDSDEKGKKKKAEKASDETTLDRAHKWGKRGALGYAGLGVATSGPAVMKTYRHIRDMGVKKGPAAGAVAGGLAIGSGINAAVGYGGGRLVHRVVHGPASDKKVKTSAERRHEKTAAIVKKAGVGQVIQQGVGHAASAIMKSPLATRAAVGAAGGAVGGAVASKDNRLGGALAGAAGGAAAGAAARPATMALKQAPGGVGQYVRKGIRGNLPLRLFKNAPVPK